MKENFKECLDALLRHEGGYVNNPNDPGGVTNLGVTKKAWQDWAGRPVTDQEIKALTPERVSLFYRRAYWNVIAGDELPSGLDNAMFDAAVNSGPLRAIKWVQQIVGVEPDGKMGSKTMTAISNVNLSVLIRMYCDHRLQFMQSLPTWNTFGKGWAKRVADVREHSLFMVV